MPVQISPLVPDFPLDLRPLSAWFVEIFTNPRAVLDALLNSDFLTSVFIFLFILSAIFAAFVAYIVIKISRAGNDYRSSFHFEPKVREDIVPERWKNVLNHIESENSSDWRMAILEADSILEEMVRRMGYEGLTLGDMLKNIEPSDFTTLNDAWEAHKVRNAIAHEGSERKLTKREAKRVVGLYERIFKEFRYL